MLWKSLFDTLIRLQIIKSGESVNWLNTIIHQIWRVMTPDLLVSIVDILEDSLVASMPSMLTNVKISHLSLGSRAPQFKE